MHAFEVTGTRLRSERFRLTVRAESEQEAMELAHCLAQVEEVDDDTEYVRVYVDWESGVVAVED